MGLTLGFIQPLNQINSTLLLVNNLTLILILGHALGIDHVGHTYEANHPEMARKLL